MIAVIKGDIIASRKLKDQSEWMLPLKKQLAKWGKSPLQWELVWGDFFQLEIGRPDEALQKAFKIKALIKEVGSIDVRMSIGIGEKTYSGKKISESNGSAFIHAGEKFDLLKKENVNLGIKSPWADFDEEINLMLQLAGVFIDKWSVSSSELVKIILSTPNIKQEEIGAQLGIKQNSVSGRWNRAHVEKLLAIESRYRKQLKSLLK